MSIHDEAPRTGDGKYTFKNQAESPVTLDAPSQGDNKTLAVLLDERDAVRERRDRIREQQGSLDLLAARYAVRGLAGTILEKYPTAATLRITQNLDGNDHYDAHQLTAADGTVLESSIESLDWTEAEAPNGTYLYEFVDDLTYDSNDWTNGIATINPATKYDFKTIDIDLKAAASATLPETPDTHDVRRRVLTEDEQSILVDTAEEGVKELEDKLSERAGDYAKEDLDALQEKLNNAYKLLGYSG